jgi:hypothetical protein
MHAAFGIRTLSESPNPLETASNRRWPGERFRRRRRPPRFVLEWSAWSALSGGDPRRATPGLAHATDFNSVTTSIEHCGFDSFE